MVQKVFGVAIFATFLLTFSCAPSGELGPEEGGAGIQTDESKATPPPTEPPPGEPPPAEPPPAQPTGEFTEGTIQTFFGDGSPDVIESPSTLAIDASDNLFVSALRRFPDPGNITGFRTVRGVFKVTPAKEISIVNTEVSSRGFITAMTFDSLGNLFVLEEVFPDQFQAHNVSRLHKISPTGTQTVVADNLTHPRGLLAMGDGRIIVSESDIANRVVELPSVSGGAFKLIAGKQPAGFSGDGGPAENAELNRPLGLAIDSKGFLYITNFGNNRIRIVNPKRGPATPFK